MKKILPIILVLILTVQLFGQKPQPKPTTFRSQPQCSLELVKTLIKEQADESKNIEDTGKRLKILYLAADFLWKYDEQTARGYLSKAFELAVDKYQEKNKEMINTEKTGYIRFENDDLRFNVLRVIAKYDAVWAKKLSENILKEFNEADKSKRNYWEKNAEIEQILNLAVEVYETNPQQSENLLNRAISYPITFQWYFILFRLAEKNQNFADSIYSKLLQKNSNSKFKELMFLQSYPFGNPSLNLLGFNSYIYVNDKFIPNQVIQKQFLSLILQRTRNYQVSEEEEKREDWEYSDVANLYHILQTFEPTVVKDFPELAVDWTTSKNQIYAFVSENEQKRLEEKYKQDKNQDELTFEKRLKKLEDDDANGELNEDNIYNLVQSAKTEEQYAKAESWLDKISDEKFREAVWLFFYYRRSDLAIRENRLDDARKFVLKIKELEFRATMLLKIADFKLKQPQGKSETMEILQEVYQTALKADNSAAKFQALFGLAKIYSKFDKQFAINTLSDSIRVFNSLENKGEAFAGMLQIMVKGKYFTGYSAFPTFGVSISSVLSEMAKSDYSNTLSQANSFSDKYYRALAVIEVAKNCPELAKAKETKVVKSKP
jgi:hypothetical protein